MIKPLKQVCSSLFVLALSFKLWAAGSLAYLDAEGLGERKNKTSLQHWLETGRAPASFVDWGCYKQVEDGNSSDASSSKYSSTSTGSNVTSK